VQFVIIGTRAVKEPYFVKDLCLEYPGHVIVGLDAREGKVAVNGWSKLSRHDVIDMAQIFERDGVEAIIYTDIGRDGMMRGVNVEATVELAQSVSIPVIASGGISTLDDIYALCTVKEEGIMGAIIGRALYEGSIDLAAAQRLVDAAIN
jgi:phosphoribosylformimino-5-aminoimidazole carboxamide ribotide isomerase